MSVPSESPWIAVSDDVGIAGVPVLDVASAGMRHQAAVLLFWSVMPAQTTLHLLLDLILTRVAIFRSHCRCYPLAGEPRKGARAFRRVAGADGAQESGRQGSEVLIRKKLVFYKEKQKRRGGDPARFMEAIGISPTDELAIFWNTHQRIDDAVVEEHIAELAALTLPVALAVPSPLLPVLDAPQAVPPADAINREPSSHVLAPATSTAPVGRPVVRCQSESTLNIGKAAHAQPFLTRAEPPAPKEFYAQTTTEPMYSGEGHQLSCLNIAQQDQLLGSPELAYEFMQAKYLFFSLTLNYAQSKSLRRFFKQVGVQMGRGEAIANQNQTPVRCSGARRTTDTMPPPPTPAVNSGRACLVIAEGNGKA
ncbi:hypothetical protein C8J57DRAFT_1484373 [Mycena rebaudengoi]|nr:hypothetical protein C8J57DRAFT_1484373 [Mycena rebaudengoi]